jgi:predicted metalloprotease with PDZ domain
MGKEAGLSASFAFFLYMLSLLLQPLVRSEIQDRQREGDPMIHFTASTLYLRATLGLIFAFLLTSLVIAQRTNQGSDRPAASATPLELSYTLSFPQPHTHLYEVTYTIGKVTTPQLDLRMAGWTPGSYLMREFERNVQDFAARDEGGRALKWEKVDKATWRIETGARAHQAKTIRANYRVYANELTVRTSHLDASHAYFNGASLFMYVQGAINQPLKLKIDAPAGWRVTTPLGLAPEADGSYVAPNYDILVDSPTEVGAHKLLEFNALGKPHRIAIWGAADYDEAELTRAFTRIIEEGGRIFGGLPYDHYTFILHLQPGIGGGLEHLNSTTCQTTPRAFKTRKGYRDFLGLIAHEYFHLWNVKRIRPLALGPFDYQTENYTRALWLAEGVTDYYGQQLLRRGGLITPAEYLEDLAGSILTYESTPGRLEQTAESASFDSWIKHYRPDENSINSAMSYYLRGELLGWLLDFEIRTRTNGARTLDDVMRLLLENYGLPRPGFTDSQLKAAFEKVAGGDLTDFFQRYVSGNEEIDFNAYLNRAGLQLVRGYKSETPYAGDKTARPGALGFRTKNNVDRVIVSNVIAGLPAYEGGVNANDELVALDGIRIDANNTSERVNILNELRAGERVTLTVFRREKLMTFALTAAVKPFDHFTISAMKAAGAGEHALRQSWLREESKNEKASR